MPSAVFPQDWQGIFQSLPQTDNPWKEEKEMSKMAEIDQIVKDLRTAADELNGTADRLMQMFSEGDTAKEEPAVAAPVKEPEKPKLTLADVRSVLADKSRAGFTAEVRGLLEKYGADRLSKVDPANYEALKKDAEVLGNGS
jgi:hypothetical protein